MTTTAGTHLEVSLILLAPPFSGHSRVKQMTNLTACPKCMSAIMAARTIVSTWASTLAFKCPGFLVDVRLEVVLGVRMRPDHGTISTTSAKVHSIGCCKWIDFFADIVLLTWRKNRGASLGISLVLMPSLRLNSNNFIESSCDGEQASVSIKMGQLRHHISSLAAPRQSTHYAYLTCASVWRLSGDYSYFRQCCFSRYQRYLDLLLMLLRNLTRPQKHAIPRLRLRPNFDDIGILHALQLQERFWGPCPLSAHSP